MNTILKSVELEPMDVTYLGIGSCPHLSKGEVLDPKYDQLIPTCFYEALTKDKKSFRILHFDPAFDRYKEFLDSYFAKWDLLPLEFPGGFSWVNNQMEVIVMNRRIEHKDDFEFLNTLVAMILNTKGKLVVQEYTGYSLKDLNKQLYDGCDQKEKYKRRVLLDMTFDTDSGCCTDMTKAQPFYDYDGNFLNFHFLTEDETRRWAGISFKVDSLLRKKYTGKFLQTLNTYHVDYRRKLKGDSVMYGSPEYTNDATSDEIMSALQRSLRKSFEILLLVRGVQETSVSLLEELFTNYATYDPYKWYDKVSKLIDREAP